MNKNKTYIYLHVIFTIISLTLLMVNYSCQQQKKEKTYVIGYVNPNPEEEEGAQGFLRNMPKFGYIEGKNVTYIKSETRDVKDMETALKDMVAKKVDMIFTITLTATKMAKELTEGTNIPVAFVLYDAVEPGIVKSLTNPGGNLTGVQVRGSTQKSLEFLKAIVPGAKHIFVPVEYEGGAASPSLEDIRQSAAKAGFRLTVSEISTVEELKKSLASMPRDIDAIFMLHSWLVGSNIDLVIDAAIKRKIPLFSAGHVDYRNGVVFSYAPTDDRTGSQAARLAHSILHDGLKTAELPVETADFFLGINLKTAHAIGLEIPDNVLQQADFIIRE